jgi:Icc protein
MRESDAPVVVVVPGDLHLTEPNLDNHRIAQRVVDQSNTLIRPDFVQFIGDNVQDATEAQFRLFNDTRSHLDARQFSLVGDHDVKGDPAASGFLRHVGEPYGETSLKGFRFIRLNTQESRPLGLSSEQIRWFTGEVDGAISRGERVVIFQHNYPYQIWESFSGPGIDDWRAIVQTRRVESIICGHTHYGQVANDGRNVVVATRSIGDPEGGAPGYTLLYFHGDDFATMFRSVEERGPVVMVTHPREKLLATGPSHVVRGQDHVSVRVWPAPAVGAVRYRVDEEAWTELESAGEGHWSGPMAGDRLTKGEHVLEVVAAGDDLAEGFQRVSFIVDPTGCYTPVPGVSPAVLSTRFC